jgi:hypothetical protein
MMPLEIQISNPIFGTLSWAYDAYLGEDYINKCREAMPVMSKIAFVLIVAGIVINGLQNLRDSEQQLRLIFKTVVIIGLIAGWENILNLAIQVVTFGTRDITKINYSGLNVIWDYIEANGSLLTINIPKVLGTLVLYIAYLLIMLAATIQTAFLGVALAIGPVMLATFALPATSGIGKNFILSTIRFLLWSLGWGLTDWVMVEFTSEPYIDFPQLWQLAFIAIVGYRYAGPAIANMLTTGANAAGQILSGAAQTAGTMAAGTVAAGAGIIKTIGFAEAATSDAGRMGKKASDYAKPLTSLFSPAAGMGGSGKSSAESKPAENKSAAKSVDQNPDTSPSSSGAAATESKSSPASSVPSSSPTPGMKQNPAWSGEDYTAQREAIMRKIDRQT